MNVPLPPANKEPQPVPIEEQKSILAEMQARHMDILIRTGLKQKIFEIIQRPHESLGTIAVSTGKKRIENGEIIEHRVSVGAYNAGDHGSESTAFTNVSVAQEFDGLVMPVVGFSQQEADLVAGLVKELEGLRDEGILPNLSPHLLSIYDPATGITIYRPPDTDNEG